MWGLQFNLQPLPSSICIWNVARSMYHLVGPWTLSLSCVRMSMKVVLNLQGSEFLRPNTRLWAMVLGPLVTQQREFTALHKIPSMSVSLCNSANLCTPNWNCMQLANTCITGSSLWILSYLSFFKRQTKVCMGSISFLLRCNHHKNPLWHPAISWGIVLDMACFCS